ncbi:MAG: DNA-binding protein [Chloroflexi bacterium AL-W]|nr:DNA-binding protein [Chloroflexi bacterium AL-N1]NOK71037.1 DNA-binding protein [Chloroflexi bacterium AL-N10]NOK72740.1 DNA-binding protein [Chloroflexi bacterium AL-N5]NOK79172.1 DNA-binding protein [Chloroflexi bacterium AL-W]NOK87087.1 DNA-binding protein [Chloroflexi bacterium AL-N15]
MTSDSLMTVEDVANWLSVEERTVTGLARKQELAGFKVGKEWRFSRDDIVDYLEQQRNRPRQNEDPIA